MWSRRILRLRPKAEHPPGRDGQASVTLYWRVLNQPDRGDYSTFAQLRDRWGFEWGKGGSFDYPSEQWTPGEIIVNRIDVPISCGRAAGRLRTARGLVLTGDEQRLNVVAADGGFGGTVAQLKPIPIEQVDHGCGAVEHRHAARSGSRPGLKLLGYTQETSEAQTGAPIDVTLFWQRAYATAMPVER